jgi:hypothetical protein
LVAIEGGYSFGFNGHSHYLVFFRPLCLPFLGFCALSILSLLIEKSFGNPIHSPAVPETWGLLCEQFHAKILQSSVSSPLSSLRSHGSVRLMSAVPVFLRWLLRDSSLCPQWFPVFLRWFLMSTRRRSIIVAET